LSKANIKHKITAIDITVLGRKIQAIYRKSEEKIDSIHHIKDNHIEKILTFVEIEKTEDKPWLLFKAAVSKSNLKQKEAFIIHRANNLYELIFWMIHNDIYRPHMTSLLIKASQKEHESAFVKSLADSLFEFFKPIKISAIKNETLLKKPVTEKLFLLSPPSVFNENSNEEDQETLKELISFKRNSWGEEFIKTYTGKNILSLVIQASENSVPEQTVYSYPLNKKIKVFTPPKSLLKAVTKNEMLKKFRYSYVILNFFKNINSEAGIWLENLEKNKNILFQYAYISDGNFKILSKKNNQNVTSSFKNFDEFVTNLASASCIPVHTKINHYGHVKMPVLERVYFLAKKKKISVFVNREEKTVDLFIVDSIGNIFYQKIPSPFFSMNLKTTHLYIISSLERLLISGNPENYISTDPEKIVSYFDITSPNDKDMAQNSKALYSIIGSDHFNFISLSIERIRTGGFFFQLDDEIFSTRVYDNPNRELAKRLLEKMKKKNASSFFITSAFLEEHFRAQTCPKKTFLCHYLIYRKLLSHHLVSIIKKL
jgi:hypothetical protein